MSERLNKSFIADNTNKRKITKESNVGIVVDVILDDTWEDLQKTDSEAFSTGLDTSVVGSCIIRPLSDASSAEADLRPYAPYDIMNHDLPLVGEAVELIKVGNRTYYKRFTKGNINIGNAAKNFNKKMFSETEKPQNTASGYSTTSQTGISNTSGNNDRNTKIGEYFEEQQINRLKYYEGDKIIQSRFGQTIRFSGYNNSENEFAPTMIIRNRQDADIQNRLEYGDIIEEDINRDGSTIAISSGAYKSIFQPGVVDDGGSSNFKTKPEHFEEYPDELTGTDQIIINTGRLVLSSKSDEMIFYSKGNYGFISDGKLSIDNGKYGADLDFNGDVNITTNDNDVYIDTGKGNIRLNTEDTEEPLVRGETLVSLLEELIDAINQQVFATPSGPTATGPTNRGDFTKIKSKLDTIKSTLNFTE